MTRFVLAMVVALAAVNPAAAADIEAGRKKAAEVCAACHGPDGNSATADFPRIAGQYADYLEKAMRDYKTGARKDPIMSGFANPLTATEIENLAAYFASQRGLQHKY
jgi:cytochrome c553